MTKKELLSGVKFGYGISKYYSINTTPDGDMNICQFGMNLVSIAHIGNKFITAYTYIMDKRVDLKIDMSKCIVMEEPAGAVIL